jgi:hypothetical protein
MPTPAKLIRTACTFVGGPADGLTWWFVAPRCVKLMPGDVVVSCLGGRPHRYYPVRTGGRRVEYRHGGSVEPC